MMTLEQAKSAMRARIVAFNGLQPAQIQWPNRAFTVPATGIWARVSYMGGDGFIAGMGDEPCTRETGMLAIQLFIRNGEGTATLSNLADSLGKWLAFYAVGSLELLAASKIDVGDDKQGFYQMNVNVPYRVN